MSYPKVPSQYAAEAAKAAAESASKAAVANPKATRAEVIDATIKAAQDSASTAFANHTEPRERFGYVYSNDLTYVTKSAAAVARQIAEYKYCKGTPLPM